MAKEYIAKQDIGPVTKPVQLPRPRLGSGLELIEVDALIKAAQARSAFGVSGAGLTVAVLDTGLRTTHVDFTGRVVAQQNFTGDNGGNQEDANDGNGHGTNVAGIIAANGDHIGVAPGVNVIPIKVLSNAGGGSFQSINQALQWVIDKREEFNISAVCMSLGDSGNYTSDDDFSEDAIRQKIQLLREHRVAANVAAGNDYFVHGSQQGMAYPCIFRETISVGAVYDEVEGSFQYGSGAIARSTAPDRITPFSQRLHEDTNVNCRTDIFAPGAPVTSSGIENDQGESVQHGTSQATPVTAGVGLLIQEAYQRSEGELPPIHKLVEWMRVGAELIHDGDDEDDNVEHTNKGFFRVDALKALRVMHRELEVGCLASA